MLKSINLWLICGHAWATPYLVSFPPSFPNHPYTIKVFIALERVFFSLQEALWNPWDISSPLLQSTPIFHPQPLHDPRNLAIWSFFHRLTLKETICWLDSSSIFFSSLLHILLVLFMCYVLVSLCRSWSKVLKSWMCWILEESPTTSSDALLVCCKYISSLFSYLGSDSKFSLCSFLFFHKFTLWFQCTLCK